MRGVEIVDDDRDVPEPGRLGLTGGRLSLRLEQSELQPRLTKKDGLVILGRLIQLRQPKHVPVPGDRAGAIGDVERDMIETLKLHTGRRFYDRGTQCVLRAPTVGGGSFVNWAEVAAALEWHSRTLAQSSLLSRA